MTAVADAINVKHGGKYLLVNGESTTKVYEKMSQGKPLFTDGNRTWTPAGKCISGPVLGGEPDGSDIACESKELVSKAELLDKAKDAVADRGLNYGKPEDNFARIAAFWNVYLRSTGAVDRDVFGPGDVAQMMILMKMARIQNQPDHLDSWVDIAGYAACGGEISCGR